uniref:Secreted protein n=1 Tax=Macrostomum lignano TaxID=282301 RepID=A0A1I8F9E3_9PLAT
MLRTTTQLSTMGHSSALSALGYLGLMAMLVVLVAAATAHGGWSSTTLYMRSPDKHLDSARLAEPACQQAAGARFCSSAPPFWQLRPPL